MENFPGKNLTTRTIDLWQLQFNWNLPEAEVCQVLEGMIGLIEVVEAWKLPADASREQQQTGGGHE